VIVALLGLAACAGHDRTAGPVPQARAYQTLGALWSAASAADAPRSEMRHVSTAPWAKDGSLRHLLPTASEYGNWQVAYADGTLALKDGTAATSVLCAVFPRRVPKTERDAFGGWLAQGLGGPAMPQLTGLNWVLWCVERPMLVELRAAIGGQLSEAAATRESPEPN
jgi:hypothetical protein